MTPKEALEAAVKHADGQKKLAKALTLAAIDAGALTSDKSIKQQNISNWINREGRCPGRWVVLVSNVVNGAVTPHDLRPDLYPISLSA